MLRKFQPLDLQLIHFFIYLYIHPSIHPIHPSIYLFIYSSSVHDWAVGWVYFEKPCIFSYFWEDPVYLSLKSAIVQHRSQNPGPELDLKKQVWTNQGSGEFSPALWLVQTCFFKSNSGPGFWLLCWTMALFRLIYTGSSQK